MSKNLNDKISTETAYNKLNLSKVSTDMYFNSNDINQKTLNMRQKYDNNILLTNSNINYQESMLSNLHQAVSFEIVLYLSMYS